MAPPIRARPRFPHSQSLPSGSFHKPLILIHQRADRMKATITENYPNWSHGSQSCVTQWSYEPCCVGPLYIWTLPDGQYWNQIDYILCSQRWRISLQSPKNKLTGDCDRLKLKKVGKTTIPFRDDLNQILYTYSGSHNRFKRLNPNPNYGGRFETL